MFERFSDSAIKAIMIAQESAGKYGFNHIDSDLVLYGLLAESTSSAAQMLIDAGLTAALLDTTLERMVKPKTFPALEKSFTADVEETFRQARKLSDQLGSDTVEPVHILYELRFRPAVYYLIMCTGLDPNAFYDRLSHRLKPMRPALEARASGNVTPVTQPKTLRDWFTGEAIEVVQRAEATAQSSGSEQVTVDHLLSALIEACTWVPPRVLATVASIARPSAKPTGRATNTDTKAAFAPDVSVVFLKAQEEAVRWGRSSIGAEHLFLGLLESVVSGTAASNLCQAGASEDMYRQVKQSLADYLNAQTPSRTEIASTPLLIDAQRVRATPRLVSTIRRALELAQLSQEKAVGVPHLLKALIETARASEVTFVQNHTGILMAVEQLIISSDCSTPSQSQPQAIVIDRLEAIMHGALAHAKRLKSKRLDINHLGLALLDENNDVVDSVVTAFGDTKTGSILRRRLEWCLLYQSFQRGYESEPGEILDLRNLDRLRGAG